MYPVGYPSDRGDFFPIHDLGIFSKHFQPCNKSLIKPPSLLRPVLGDIGLQAFCTSLAAFGSYC